MNLRKKVSESITVKEKIACNSIFSFFQNVILNKPLFLHGKG